MLVMSSWFFEKV